MFNHKHYVPVLRWKQAEWLALESLDSDAKSRITPVVEFIPGKLNIPDGDSLNQNISKTCKDIFKRWGKAPIFIDLQHCPKQDIKVLNRISPLALSMELSLIPVVNLGQSVDWRAAVAEFINYHKVSACIRLYLGNVFSSSIRNQLNQCLADVRVGPKSVNLIIDYGFMNTASTPSFSEALSRLPYLNDWLTVSIIGGSFPKDLSGFRPGVHTLARLDWLNWHGQMTAQSSCPRLPTYGDYTIQHPIYSEPPARANFSASIRYTATNHWVIMRGEGVFSDNSPGFAQYPAQAALLREHDDFRGRDFSAGDMYIDDVGGQTEVKGSAGSWLRAGINHHMTLVVRELASFDEI